MPAYWLHFRGNAYVRDHILANCSIVSVSRLALRCRICMRVSNTRANHLAVARGHSYRIHAACCDSGRYSLSVDRYVHICSSANAAAGGHAHHICAACCDSGCYHSSADRFLRIYPSVNVAALPRCPLRS
jgi:hypothetical protein